MTDVLTGHATQPIPPHPSAETPVPSGGDDLHDAARRYGTATTAVDAWRHASTEADEALRLADCDTLDAVNDDCEAKLDSRREYDKTMGFTAVDPKSDPVDLSVSGREAEKAKLSYQRYRASAMRAEALYSRALREVAAAEQHLLEVSRARYSSATEQAGASTDVVSEEM